MATIKAIEGRSVHQIQSGQVIVDLVSVVKELVENGLDAGATSIDVRFKNNGLDSIEVQDNGNGIAPDDFESLALKHHTSKLSSFEDLDSLQTFGFRGEALSSLSALSALHIITARAQDGAVGKKLTFELSGRLQGVSVVAAQKGTTVSVENLFHNLPVRRKELVKNIKREYGKVLNFLQSYACICVGIRLAVSNQMPKGKKMTAFSTKGNLTTKENIANVFGAKMLTALVKVDLRLDMNPSMGPTTQSGRNWPAEPSDEARTVQVEGHISKPGWGEGRQTPDRQMFFVNSRPCSIPQVTKVVNEVYRSFNHHQSPFILANFIMDTNSYDVNVSPDKKTIMLHDQTALLEALKAELTMLFENIEHVLPETQLSAKALPAFKPLTGVRRPSAARPEVEPRDESQGLIGEWAARDTAMRDNIKKVDGSISVTALDGPMYRDESIEDRADGSSAVEHGDAYNADYEPNRGEHERDSTGTSATVPDNELLDEGTVDTIDMAIEPLATERRDAGGIESTPADDVQLQAHPELPDTTATSSVAYPARTPTVDAFARMSTRPLDSGHIEKPAGEDPDSGPQRTAGSWSKRRKVLTIKRGVPNSSVSTILSQFAAPGSQLQLNFAEQHASTTNDERDDELAMDNMHFTAGDGTPELRPEHDETDDDQSEVSQGSAPHSPERASETVMHDSLLAEEGAKKRQEEEAVARLIRAAEQDNTDAPSTSRGVFAAHSPIKRRDATYDLSTSVATSLDQIERQVVILDQQLTSTRNEQRFAEISDNSQEPTDAESKLSLTVSKADFDKMQVIGQFNLGFILALRPAMGQSKNDELFIVDQHAADEKYNYERLQSTVVLQHQRLVKAITLELSAVEQEVVLNHQNALQANGFEIEVSDEGDSDTAVQTFRLLTLPMINQKTFQLSDLEELLHLLSDLPAGSSDIPRPRKVQRMLAMRACRSSIMVGKTLTAIQMSKVVKHMGGMDKPWNCPHGRPTMRHLYKLDGWQAWHDHDQDRGPQLANEINEHLRHHDKHAIWQQWLETQ